MERPRILVAYYSRSGRTKRLARAVAAALAADVEEIRDPTDRAGVLGFLRSGVEAYARVLAGVEHPRRDPGDYDVVVVGTPVWAMSVSSPVRTYLWHERERLPQVAFLATLAGRGDERAFEQMRELAGRAPVATLAVREPALARDEIARFAEAVVAGAHRRRARRGGGARSSSG
jgi:menaquinone-dependent protoporphyrinogen IX oxidase